MSPEIAVISAIPRFDRGVLLIFLSLALVGAIQFTIFSLATFWFASAMLIATPNTGAFAV